MSGERTGHTCANHRPGQRGLRSTDRLEERSLAEPRALLAVSAQLMRRILVDFARSHSYQKRGGNLRPVTLDETDLVDAQGTDMVALDEALKSLAELDARQSKVVELRFFGGLTNDEVAEVLNVSEATVRRDWSLARAWLHRELSNREA